MAITYSWEIVQLECYPEHENRSDVVFLIHWKRKADDGKQTLDSYGACGVPYNAENAFTSFDKLTQADIENWLVSELGDDLALIDANLERRLNVPPIVAVNPPWSK